MKVVKLVPLGLLAGLTVGVGSLSYSLYQSAENSKKDVQTHDSARYIKALQNEPSKFCFGMQERFWHDEAREMHKAIEIDSIAKKAYFEGAQMVRDSIAKANKE